MLEARGLIVRSKLMLPDGKGNSGWTTTQLIHLPRYAPRLAIGSEAIIRVREGSEGEVAEQEDRREGTGREDGRKEVGREQKGRQGGI